MENIGLTESWVRMDSVFPDIQHGGVGAHNMAKPNLDEGPPNVIRVKISTGAFESFPQQTSHGLQRDYSPIQARSWIDIYNIAANTKLRYITRLENALHVVEIVEEVGSHNRDALLVKGHVDVGGHSASFN